MRTFIAIELPAKVKTSLSNIQNELKQSHADVKWVESGNIHLTLKFLGEIQQDLVEKIQLFINEIAHKNHPFNLCLSGLGAFPKPQYPRVIWIGLTDNEGVSKIAKDLEEALITIGIPAESREFSSHITLGRVRSSFNRKELVEKLEFLNKNLSPFQLEFNVSSITLFKSTLTPQGPIYEAIFTSPLG